MHIRLSVMGLLRTVNNEIALIQRLQNPKANYWDLPGGGVHPHEKLISALQREIYEEINLSPKNYQIDTLLTISESFYPHINGGVHSVSIIYVCQTEGCPPLVTNVVNEVKNVMWCPFDELREMLSRTEFTNRSKLAFRAAGIVQPASTNPNQQG